MSSDPNIVIDVRGLGKCYQIYAEPIDRLKQFVLPRLSRAVGPTACRLLRVILGSDQC